MAHTLLPNVTGITDAATAEIFFEGLMAGTGAAPFTLWMKFEPADTRITQNVGVRGPGAYNAAGSGAEEIPVVEIEEGNTATYTQSEFHIGYGVGRSTRRWFMASRMGEFIGQIGFSAGQKLTSLAYAQLTDGFTVSGTGGETLFADAHAGGAGTQDNRITTSLGYTALGTIRQMAREQLTYAGMKGGFTPIYLVIPAELETTAKQILSAEFTAAALQPTTHQGSLQILINTHQTDTDDYMVLGSTRETGLRGYLGVGPSPLAYTRQGTFNLEIVDWMQVNFGWDHWYGTVGAVV